MSSRVQKGSTVFRPVVKNRSKFVPAASRQPSVVLEPPNVDLERPSNGQSPPISQQQTPSTANTNSTNTLNFVTEERSPAVPPLVRSSVISIPTRPVRLTSGPSMITPRNSKGMSPVRAPTDNLNSIIGSPSVGPSETIASTIEEKRTESIATTSQIYNNFVGSSTIPESARSTAFLTDSTSMPTLSSDQGTSQDDPKAITKTGSGEESSRKFRKRKPVPVEGDDPDNAAEAVESKRSKLRSSHGTPRPRKRAPSPPPYDPDADPGEDIDPTSVTMAALCSDTGQGRVSRKAIEILSNHAAWKIKNKEKRARMKMLMEAKKYGRQEEVDAEQSEEQNEFQVSANEEGPSTSKTAPAADQTGSGFDYSQDLATSRFNVQVRIGPNGETVIDEDSLVVDRSENDGTENYTHVVESDHTKFINSGSYSKRYRGSRWTAEETDLFYDALAQYGENYELIALMLPGRDRKSCKNKFKIEDKKNHARINHCLNNSIPVDVKTLSRLTGKDFSGPVPEIRMPPSIPPPLPGEEFSGTAEEASSQTVKKRSRSNSRSVKESDVVIVGDVGVLGS